MEEKKRNDEILIYQSQDGTIKVDVWFEDETVWLTIDQMCTLFGKSRSTINEHILNIYKEGELSEADSMRKIGISDFSTKPTNYYNLDVIISSRLPCQIPPRYAVPHLGDTAPEGISDKGIRAERRTLQTIWAVSGKTAAELIYYRANADLPLMGLTSTAYPDKVLKSDIVIGKNYLSEEEINMLKLIVEQFLAFAEAQAAAHKPMYMKDWIDKLRLVLTMNEKSVLEDAGRISHQLALKKAEQEYNKYKEIKLSQGHWDSIKELDEDLKRLQSQSRKKGRGSGGFFK